jgi:hypothetical protein
MITAEMKVHKDNWSNVESFVIDGSFETEFDSGYGSPEGPPFTVWTAKRVYFPICYDGSEWCGSVSRYPNGKVTKHQGG